MDTRKMKKSNRKVVKAKIKNRKSLSTLQPSADNQSVLVGSNGIVDLNLKKSGLKENISLNTKENELSSLKEVSKKDAVENAKELMCNPEISAEYWKILAEERRVALEAALKENEDLRDQIEVLETENSQLREICEEAKRMAEIINDLNE
ncbi:geminin-like [Centruroides sculpturatus]|uniref:geminin-like n=1 Tax=Centruroides sculpturatus TaxID=218467 RepID=UPI000C6D6B72|nr:geminin-like [Centruroides sculpturatus]